jgi:general secretion pathway protein L
LRKTLADSVAGANFLSDKKRNNPLTVALLDDISKRLPEDTFLERLQIENGEAQLQGQSKEAAKLISLLASSNCLGDPRLQGQIQPDARTGKERFQITADIKGCNGTPSSVKAAPAAEAAANAKRDANTSEAPLKPEAAKPDAAKKGAPKKDLPKKDAMKKDATSAMQPSPGMHAKEKRAQQQAAAKEPVNGGQ